MPRLVIFLDLDDTILQTAPKCPLDQMLTPAALNRAGEILSFMTPVQQWLLEFWQERAIVIPVTGRTDSALERVMIAFSSWRITHHGAVIRQPNGLLPTWWHDEIRPLLSTARRSLDECAAWLNANAMAGNYRVNQHMIEECLTYISVKSDDNGAALIQLKAQLLATGLTPELTLHCNGNNFALMVKGAQKHNAVQRVLTELERDGPLVTLGAGDSLTDLPFMQICDFALVPKTSQIQTETWGCYLP